MAAMLFEQRVDKVYRWVGQRLSACPIRDGITFYHRSEKVFKLLKQKTGWHLQFNVPVPECSGLVRLSQTEARKRKLGKAQWIYKGDSEEDAQRLILAALDSLPQRWVIEPAMSRDITTVCGGTCPCFKKMEHLTNAVGLPENLTSLLTDAYTLLLNGQYVEFVEQMQLGIEEATEFLLREKGEEPNGDVQGKIQVLISLKVIPKSMGAEGDILFNRREWESARLTPDRAYPMALMFISFLTKLVKEYI